MIKSITIANFFSFGEKQETIEFNKDTNILLGINGSGKSNLLKALQLLYEGVFGKGFQELFMKDWGGFDNIGNFSRKRSNRVLLKFEFANHMQYEIIIIKLNNTQYAVHDSGLQNNDRLFWNTSEEKIRVIEKSKPVPTFINFPRNNIGELSLKQIANISSYPTRIIVDSIQELVVYTYFDTTLKSPIRQLSSYSIEHRLAPNGENLIQVLLRIKNHHSLAYEKIEDALKTINPLFKDISFDIIASKVLLVLREKGLAKSVTIEHISDGTLRYLLLLSIVFNPERGKIICLDEPEIGLHPDMINSIAKAIKEAAAEGTQFIIATHSPLLLNCFELEDVLIFEKNEANESIVSYKSEEDFEEDGLLVGQRWLSGQLGGVRW